MLFNVGKLIVSINIAESIKQLIVGRFGPRAFGYCSQCYEMLTINSPTKNTSVFSSISACCTATVLALTKTKCTRMVAVSDNHMLLNVLLQAAADKRWCAMLHRWTL